MPEVQLSAVADYLVYGVLSVLYHFASPSWQRPFYRSRYLSGLVDYWQPHSVVLRFLYGALLGLDRRGLLRQYMRRTPVGSSLSADGRSSGWDSFHPGGVDAILVGGYLFKWGDGREVASDRRLALFLSDLMERVPLLNFERTGREAAVGHCSGGRFESMVDPSGTSLHERVALGIMGLVHPCR